MSNATRIATLAVLGLAMVAAACKKKPETAPTPGTGASGSPGGPTCDAACRAAIDDSIRKARAADSARAAEAAAAERARLLAATKATLAQVILFDYDQSDLTPESRAILDAKIPIFRANPNLRIQISGHADERGSDEYNLALGQRRAVAAKRYLTDLGIDGNRIEVMSYGEERPVVTDGTEEGFRRNRRAEFAIVSGESTLVPVR
jgi:peptidoglycan-associated lipoprotein